MAEKSVQDEARRLDEARKLIAQVGKIMLDRNLTDLAGGNISARINDKVLMSPSYAGTRKFWQLQPEDVFMLDLRGNVLEGGGRVSREAPTHLKLLNAFYPSGQAVIHSHARNVLAFCAARQAIPPVLEYACKFGEIKLAEYARGGTHSEKLAENVYQALLGQEERMALQAAAVMVPWHGLFAIGKDLHSTLDAVERIEINARCVLYGRLLQGGEKNMKHCQADLARRMKSAGGEGE